MLDVAEWVGVAVAGGGALAGAGRWLYGFGRGKAREESRVNETATAIKSLEGTMTQGFKTAGERVDTLERMTIGRLDKLDDDLLEERKVRGRADSKLEKRIG